MIKRKTFLIFGISLILISLAYAYLFEVFVNPISYNKVFGFWFNPFEFIGWITLFVGLAGVYFSIDYPYKKI